MMAAASLTAGLSLPAAGDEPSATGWWWMGRPSAAVPVVSPVPAVPDGGLYVAGSPAGPSGISALRFEVGGDATSSTLALQVAEVVGTPTVDACPATEPWEPAEGGPWDERPVADCDAGAVVGAVSEDGTTVSFSLGLLQRDGVLDIVLVPGADPSSEQPATFSVSFLPPGPDALTVARPIETDTDPVEPTSAEPPAPSAAQPTALAASPLEPSFDPGAFVSPPLTGSPSPLTAAFPAADFPTSGFPAAGYAYPAVFALPLVLLGGARYLAWALTRPVVVRTGPR